MNKAYGASSLVKPIQDEPAPEGDGKKLPNKRL